MIKPKHRSVMHFLNSGLFEEIQSFSEFESRVSELPNNHDKGNAFEVFAEAYLATQKITLARDVWPFEAIPLTQRQMLSLDTGRDMGVDGTYLTSSGELFAYQVKFRSNRTALTWDELATFMGLTDQVSQRVLFTNTETLPALMQDRIGFVAVRGSDLDRLTNEDFQAIHQWLQSGKIELPRKQPMPHQVEALKNIAAGLQTNARATVVMACGTGKSLVALWASEQHGGKNVLVLVPSLALVRQLLHEWLRQTSLNDLTFMCVCSDPSVAKGADDIAVHQSDLDFPVTTESAMIRQFLSKPFNGTRIIFSTYQSAQVVADGMPLDSDGKCHPFDLGIFDEAHKTASRNGTRFSFALEDTNLPIRQRLFFSATPRHYDVRKKDKEGDSKLVYSMDQPEIYGPVVHTLGFAEAARKGIICDYKVIISVVTSGMVNDHLLSNGEVIVAGESVKARQVAQQIALQKAVEKYDVSRIFTFHGSVNAARSFTSVDGEGIKQHLPEFNTLHVSGDMLTAQREEQMKFFRQASKAIISNARCLTEGVDVPAVDMVAFISPRKSKVDIVQATGRAMRRSPSKEFGYVMVPLFVEQATGESIEHALKRTGFDDIWDLLGAMREHDEALVDIIREMKEEKGRTGGYNDRRFNERVEVLGPSISLETIREAITAECLESLGASWDGWFGKLMGFVGREGHANIHVDYQTADGYKLGQWVSAQRRDKDSIVGERKNRLDSVPGWIWNIFSYKWEEGFRHLVDFSKLEGHTMVKKGYITDDGYRLDVWVLRQRRERENLLPDQIARLESLPGWVWDVSAEKWNIGFFNLLEFINCQGHCRVPQDFRTVDGFRLGQWVGTQRRSPLDLDKERKEKLESLPGWAWSANDARWEAGYQHLLEFIKNNNNCGVPRDFQATDGFKLGVWIKEQRTRCENLSSEQKLKLESLPGWSWNIFLSKWEAGFLHFIKYVNDNGKSQVPWDYETFDGYKLGSWVATQRSNKNKLTIEQVNRLEAVSGWSWEVFSERWDTSFRKLEEYACREGGCLVPIDFKTGDGFKLGIWVRNQRATKERMPHARRELLEALPGWFWRMR